VSGLRFVLYITSHYAYWSGSPRHRFHSTQYLEYATYPFKSIISFFIAFLIEEVLLPSSTCLIPGQPTWNML